MTTKRASIDRRRKPQVTPEAVDLFIRCEQLYPIYLGCLRQPCQSSIDGRHCDRCREYLTISVACRAAPHNLIARPGEDDERWRRQLLAELDEKAAS